MLSLSLHRAIELVIGLLLAGVPLAAGVDVPGGVIACVVLGSLIVTLALSADHEGRSLAGTGHAAADRLLAVALAVAALVLAIAGAGGPAAACAGAAVVEAFLSVTTRYAVRPGRDDERGATTVPTS